MKRITWMIAIMLMATVTAYGGGLTSEEDNFVRHFEKFREKYKLTMPMLDNDLVEGSKAWAARMRTTSRFSHGAAWENIYRGSESGEAAFRAWERSKGHRALLLNPNIVTFGIGGDGTYWTFRAKTKDRSVVREREVVAQPVIVNQPLVAMCVSKACKIKKRHCCR